MKSGFLDSGGGGERKKNKKDNNSVGSFTSQSKRSCAFNMNTSFPKLSELASTVCITDNRVLDADLEAAGNVETGGSHSKDFDSANNTSSSNSMKNKNGNNSMGDSVVPVTMVFDAHANESNHDKVKPISLDDSGNDVSGAANQSLGTESIVLDDDGGSSNATPVQSASDGSPSNPNQPLVEQLVSSARKNFEVAMNQVQH